MDKVDLEGYQFFASPSDRALMSEILARLAAVEEENRQIKTALSEKDDEIAALREEIQQQNLRMDALSRRGTVLAERMERIEEPAPVISQKTAAATEEHQNHVKALLLKANGRRLSIKDIAPRLGLTRQQTWNVINRMERRRLVNVINDPHHRQRKLVELHQQIGTPSNY